MKRYNNYHRHDHISSLFGGVGDSNVKAIDYVNRCIELGHNNFFTTQHGTFGDIFEAFDLCQHNNLRCLPGLEGYIVVDNNPELKDKSNYHIMILPITDKARKKCNYYNSLAHMQGFYYKPRWSLDYLMQFTSDELYITTACCAGLLHDEESIEKILMPLIQHFGDHVLLEVQNHQFDIQRDINKKAIALANSIGLKLCAANDSHYIYPWQSKERHDLMVGKRQLEGKPDAIFVAEDEFVLDYPDYDTFFKRFEQQGILTEDQIETAIANTLIFDDIEEVQLDYEIKMPNIYPDIPLNDRMKMLEDMVWKKFEETKRIEHIPESEIPRYIDGINYELQIIKDTNEVIHTCDYFLFNTKNVDLAVNKYHGILTRGGRGSCASFYTNKLLGMTQLDRFQINLPIFPDRFASTARLIDNRALPDIDFNCEAQEPFVKASKELLGENGCYPMVAYTTMQEGEAFRNVCRSHGLQFDEFNDVAKNLDQYREDKKWKPLIEEAEHYVGTIVSASVHPCFEKNELVKTSKGYIPISNIEVGDYVLSSDNEYHKVINTMISNSSDIYKLKISGRPEITVTGNHPFYVKHMKRDGYGKRKFSEAEWVDVSNLRKDDFVGIPINNKAIIPQIKNIPTYSSDFWWIVGRYLGDGWLKKKYSYRRDSVITICCNKNETEEITLVLNKLKKYNYWIDDERTTNKINIADKYLYEFLEDFGMGAGNKEIPNYVIDLPVPLLSSLVEGYISADGYKYPDGRIHYTTISKKLALSIADCIQKCYGTYCSICQEQRRDNILEGRLLKGNIQYIGQYIINPFGPNYYINQQYIWVRYKDKKPLNDNISVYNLEVEGVHTYTVNGIMVHNCAHVLSDKDLLYEYGVARFGDFICVMITSGEADQFKVLKNDYLIVSVWKLIHETFEEIGQPIMTAHDLLNAIKDDQRVWDLFKNGITCTLNQVDSDNGMQQAKAYGIKSFEDGALIAAAIRPSFDAWRPKFLHHEKYSTGSKDLDKVLEQTQHYILFQENLMQYFDWLGVTPAESIGLIKKISKKKIKPEDFAKLEERLKNNWVKQTGSEDMFSETWDMIQGCMAYGFASPHAAATSLDMCYGAYLKVNYPLEYMTVCLNNYAGDAERTAKLKKELEYFNIKLTDLKFGLSRSKYSYDKTQRIISKGIGSVKFLNDDVAEGLYKLSQDNKYNNFIDLLIDITEKTTCNARQLDILIRLGYFNDFGEINQLLYQKDKFAVLYTKGKGFRNSIKQSKLGLAPKFIEDYYEEYKPAEVKEINMDAFLQQVYSLPVEVNAGFEETVKKCEKHKKDTNEFNGYNYDKLFKLTNMPEDIKQRFATKTSEAEYKGIDGYDLLTHLKYCGNPRTTKQIILDQLEYLSYISYTDPKADKNLICVTNLNAMYSPTFTAYRIADGTTCQLKVHKTRNPKNHSVVTSYRDIPFEDGDILLVKNWAKQPKVRKGDPSKGEKPWEPIVPYVYEWWINDYTKRIN